jgi:hypothetical protein
MPCCNLLSDRPEHQDFVIANLADPGTSIFDVYAGRLSGWRRSMVTFGPKEAPCTTCRHRDIPSASENTLASALASRLASLRG